MNAAERNCYDSLSRHCECYDPDSMLFAVHEVLRDLRDGDTAAWQEEYNSAMFHIERARAHVQRTRE